MDNGVHNKWVGINSDPTIFIAGQTFGTSTVYGCISMTAITTTSGIPLISYNEYAGNNDARTFNNNSSIQGILITDWDELGGDGSQWAVVGQTPAGPHPLAGADG